MANSITDTILKVIVDATGVKAGADVGVQQLSRLVSAASKAQKDIARDLGKINSTTGNAGFQQSTGSFVGPLEQFLKRTNASAGFDAAVARKTFNRDALDQQAREVAARYREAATTVAAYSSAVKRAANAYNNAAAIQEASNLSAKAVQNAIAGEAEALKNVRRSVIPQTAAGRDVLGLSLRPRDFGADADGLASIGARDAGRKLKAIGVGPSALGADGVLDVQSKLKKLGEDASATLTAEIAERRTLIDNLKSLGVKEDLYGKTLDDLRSALRSRIGDQFDDIGRRQAAFDADLKFKAEAPRRRELLGTLAKFDLPFEEARKFADPDLALDKLEAEVGKRLKRTNDQIEELEKKVAADRDRLRGLTLPGFRDIAQQRAREATQSRLRLQQSAGSTATPSSGEGTGIAGALAAGTSTAVSGIATAATFALRKTGGFVAQEFVNFVSRVSADLSSRLIATATEGFFTLSSKAIEAAAKYEDAIASFGVLAGSPRRGTELVDQLQQLAIATPFKLSEVLDESKILLSYGVSVDDLTKRLSQLGDVASGTGVDLSRLSLAFGQVLSKGKLQGQEIRQFTEAGVGIRDFVDAYRELTGKRISTSEFFALSEAGQVSAAVVEKAFDRMTEAGGRFAGFMDVRAKTIAGRFNSLSESATLLAQKVGKSLFDRLGIGDGIESITKRLNAIDFAKIDQTIGDVSKPIKDFARQFFEGSFAVLKAGFNRVFGEVTVSSFSDVLKYLNKSFVPGLLTFFKGVAEKFLQLGSFLAETFGRIADAAVKLSEVVSRVYDLLPDADITSKDNLLKLGEQVINPAGIFTGGPIGSFIRKNFGVELFGESPAGPAKVENAATKVGDALSDLVKNIKTFDPGTVFTAVADQAQKEADRRAEEAAKAEAVKVSANDKEIARQANFALSGIVADKNPFQSPVFKPAALKPLTTNERLALRRDLPIDQAQAVIDSYSRKPVSVSDKNVKGFRELLGGDFGDVRRISKAVNFAAGIFENIAQTKLPKNMEELAEKLVKSASTLPDFEQSIKNVRGLTGKVEDAAEDFRRDLKAIDFLNSPAIKDSKEGLTDEQARLARGRRGLALLEQFKPAERTPAPLVRQGTQEAESALTKAVYENFNTNKTAEQILADIRTSEEHSIKQRDTEIEKLQAIGDALGAGNKDLFQRGAGVGFPP